MGKILSTWKGLDGDFFFWKDKKLVKGKEEDWQYIQILSTTAKVEKIIHLGKEGKLGNQVNLKE